MTPEQIGNESLPFESQVEVRAVLRYKIKCAFCSKVGVIEASGYADFLEKVDKSSKWAVGDDKLYHAACLAEVWR